VSAADIDQIARIANWYLASKIISRKPDIAAGTITLQEH
jgi:hypothetical protein